MYRLFFAACIVWTAAAEPVGRVFFMSFDGLGQQLVDEDPAARELRVLRELRRRGTSAAGLIAAFPSTTANSHAALWTGAYAGVNGIFANRNLALPRSEHKFTDRTNGFRSDGLTAEPIWITAARQGVRVVAHQVTQAYPFLPQSVGQPPARKLTLVNGYQSKSYAPWRVLRRAGVRPCEPKGCFEWDVAAGVRARAIPSEAGLRIQIAPAAVDVALHAEEATPPRGRELARYWSKPLSLSIGVPASVVFRLFEYDAASGDFVLLQSPVQETAVFQGGTAAEVARRLVAEAGPMIGNGASHLYGTRMLGARGVAERRYFETIELVVKQQIAHSEWLFRHADPRLHITYLPYPDEMDDAWLGLDRAGDKQIRELRRWGYAAVDRAMEAFAALAGPRDHLVVVSDHGMTAITNYVDLNVALQRAGLRGQAAVLGSCVVLNTNDWKESTITDRKAALDRVESALRSTGVVTKIFRSSEDLARYGLTGPAAPDLCFDLQVSYTPAMAPAGDVIARAAISRGAHGFDPERRDMQAVLTVAGPGVGEGERLPVLRSVVVAPLIAKLLGIEPPAKARAQPPIVLTEGVSGRR